MKPQRVKTKVANVFPFGDCLVPDVKVNWTKHIIKFANSPKEIRFACEHIRQEGIKSEREQIKRIINEDRDKGNIVGGGFSPALCLSKILKHLEISDNHSSHPKGSSERRTGIQEDPANTRKGCILPAKEMIQFIETMQQYLKSSKGKSEEKSK